MKKIVYKILCPVLMATMMAGCSGMKSGEEGVSVQPVSVLLGIDLSVQSRYAGKVVPQETQEVTKDELRVVKEILVEEGDEVKAGDTLFTYDMDETRLSIEQGKLELEKMKNSITVTKNLIKTLQDEMKNLGASDKLEYTLQIQTEEANIKQTEYNISTKEKELERLEKALEQSEVVAEIDGVIQSITEEGYDNYGNPLPFMTIMQIGNYRVKGTVNEMNSWSLPMGSTVIIRSRVDERLTWEGTLQYVDYEAPITDQNNMYYYSGNNDEMTVTSKYPFYVDVPNGEGLMLGQHVFIELGGQSGESGLWMPSYYLVEEEDKVFAWVANDLDELEKRELTIGQYDEVLGEYEILGGLTETDYIALPAEGLAAGQKVTRYDENSFSSGETTEDPAFEGEEPMVEGEDMEIAPEMETYDLEMEDPGFVSDDMDVSVELMP